MPEFRIKIEQVYKVHKQAVLTVEVDTVEKAIEAVDIREVSIPGIDDDVSGVWNRGTWTLEHEVIEEA